MSNTNKVACFYTELKENSKNKLFTKQCFELIDYWKKSWKSNGWNTVVLDEEYIKDEEYYKLLEFDRFYDSNLCKHTIDFSCEYSRACYMRWLAYYKYAKENGFDVFATTLGISRWKDLNQINNSGLRAANRYNNLTFWDFNWRKQGGSSRMLEISKQEKFYKQEYCGCVYSLRDTNRWRKSNGREIIKRGINFYEIK